MAVARIATGQVVLALGFVSSLILCSWGAPASASTVALWNFQNVNGGTTGTAVPAVGAGTISVIGGATHPGFNSGSGSTDPVQPGFGYQTETYQAQSQGSGTRGVQFGVPTTGFTTPQFTGLDVSFDLRTSNTSSRWFRFDYTVNGTDWVEGTPVRMGAEANAGDRFHNNNVRSITDPQVLNNADFGFRVVSVFSPDAFTQVSGTVSYDANVAYEVARNNGQSAYAGGTWRFDMVTVNAVPEPASLALSAVGLGLGGLGVWRRRRSKHV
jgi:hypothetical protein